MNVEAHNFVRSAAIAFIRAWFNKPFEDVKAEFVNYSGEFGDRVWVTYKKKMMLYSIEEWRLALEIAFYKLALGGVLKHVIETKLEFMFLANMITQAKPMELN